MAGIRLELNRSVDENYAFFCPHALIHLSQTQPRGIAPRLSSSILTGLRFGTLIDVDGVVDLETGELKQSTVENLDVNVASICEGVITDGVQDNEEEEKEEMQVTPKKSRKRSTKTTK